MKWGQYALCLDDAENLNNFTQSFFFLDVVHDSLLSCVLKNNKKPKPLKTE